MERTAEASDLKDDSVSIDTIECSLTSQADALTFRVMSFQSLLAVNMLNLGLEAGVSAESCA